MDLARFLSLLLGSLTMADTSPVGSPLSTPCGEFALLVGYDDSQMSEVEGPYWCFVDRRPFGGFDETFLSLPQDQYIRLRALQGPSDTPVESKCYFLPAAASWSSEGVDVIESGIDTSTIRCRTVHL